MPVLNNKSDLIHIFIKIWPLPLRACSESVFSLLLRFIFVFILLPVWFLFDLFSAFFVRNFTPLYIFYLNGSIALPAVNIIVCESRFLYHSSILS